MPIDIHGLQKRYERTGAFNLPSIADSVKSYRSTLQARKKEVLEPFGLDDLDKFKDDPRAFAKAVDRAVDSFKEKKEQNALYKKVYEDGRCLVTFTNRPKGASAAGSHLKIDGEVKCPWCVCVKHPENEKWWKEYKAAALAFIYAKDDACCIVLTARDSLDTIKGSFAFSQVEGIENKGLSGNPEEQRKVLERLYGKTGLSDSRLGELLRPAMEPMRGRLEKTVLSESLVAAARDGDAGCVKECLDLGADTETRDRSGGTALHWAASGNRPGVCKMLIDAGANVDAWDRFECAPLHHAANGGHLEACKLLLNAGAVVDARNIDGCTPLHWAASEGHPEVCKLLIDAGADVDFRDNEGKTPLHWAAGRGRLEIVKLLIESGADVNASDKSRYSSLHSAASGGHLEICKLLMDAGADLDARDGNGCAPLHWAARNNYVGACKVLIDAAADVNARDKDGNTPLSAACAKGYQEVVEVLVKAGARE